jgi:hypothetical protein
MKTTSRLLLAALGGTLTLIGSTAFAQYAQHGLVSYLPGAAHYYDPNLNGWGMDSAPRWTLLRLQYGYRSSDVLFPD